jgi:transposase
MGQLGLAVRQDISAVVLRKKARSEKDGRLASRLFGIANILDGMNRDEAAKLSGMTRQTLRDWVSRYNAQGIEGLRSGWKGKTKRALSTDQEARLRQIVLDGPPADGVLVRWRRVDLRAVIKQEFGVDYHERSVGKVLKRLGFVRLSVRPRHPEADEGAQDDFKKTLPTR